MTDIWTRVREGEFKNQLPYPKKPSEPALLRKRASELTHDEAVSLAAVKAEFEADKIAYQNDLETYRAEGGRLEQAFQDALEEEFGVKGHPKAALLYSKAYEMGHSAGHSEVLNYYSDLVDLIK